MLKLISRLYDADSGTVQIGGTDIREIHTDSLFKYVSIVFQEVILFNTSIMENIRLGRLDASDEEVIRAAKLAGCNEFVSRLPDTYQTIIGEKWSQTLRRRTPAAVHCQSNPEGCSNYHSG